MTNALADADRMMPRRALRGDSRGPLAQYPLAAMEDDVSDSAKTLERRPVTHAVAAKLVAVPPPKALNPNRTEEIQLEDVLEAIPLVANDSRAAAAASPVIPVGPPPAPLRVDALPYVAPPRITANFAPPPPPPPVAPSFALPRAPRAGNTQEIDVADVLEVVQIDHRPASVYPVTADVGVRRRFAELTIDNYRLPVRRNVALILAGILASALLLLVVAIAATRPSSSSGATAQRSAAPVAKPATFARSLPPVAAAPPPAANTASGGVPEVSVLSLPRVPPTTGTLRLEDSAIGHRFFVDGALQVGESVEVRCGRHVVKVGSAGHPHVVVVGCGEEVSIGH
jgi:hypothetical protein